MITWFDMPAEGLSPGSQAIIPTGKITITENGEDIDVAQYATADVNVSGGGGSSDFSTAEVTVTNQTLNVLNVPYLDNVDDTDFISTEILTSGTYDILLYKNYAFGFLTIEGDEPSVVVTGDIEYSNGEFNITGDGTITIS